MDKFWNGKFSGIFAAIWLMITRLVEIFLDKATTFFVSKNLMKFGQNSVIRRGFKYRLPKNIIIGNNVEIGQNVIFSSELLTGSLVIEDDVVIGRNCKIDFSGNLVICRGTLLSEGVNIQTHDHGLNPKSQPIGKELNIGKNCWIGLNVMILSNTKMIADNTVVGAQSLVTKSITEQGIYVGNPLKQIIKK